MWGEGGFFVFAPVLFLRPGSSFSLAVLVCCRTVIIIPYGETEGVRAERPFSVLFACPYLWFCGGC